MIPWQGLNTTPVNDRATREALVTIDYTLRDWQKRITASSTGGGGGSGTITGAESFLTVVNEASLTGERALAVTAPITKSDGGANGSLTLGFTFATPSIQHGTTYAAGVATSGIRSDSTIKYPNSLMSDANSALLTMTDDAASVKLTNSLGNITIDTPSIVILAPVATAASRMDVNIDADFNTTGVRSAWLTGTPPTSTTLVCWDARYASSTFNLSNNNITIVGVDNSSMTVTPSGGAGTGLKMYGFRSTPQIGNATGTWTEAACAYFQGPRRSFVSPTITTQAGVILEPPTAATSDQIGLLIRQQTAQATATNRLAIDILTHNSGTNRWSLRAADRVEIQSQAAQATTALLLRQLATGAAAGAHVNLDDKAGDPPAPNAGDLWRNGASLNYRKDGATTVDLTAAAGGGDSITVNAAAVVDADFDDATPVAPTASPATNVKWQKDASSPANISAYAPMYMKQTEIDFGSTPVAEAAFTVTDAQVTSSSKIIGSVSNEAPTGKDLDELEMDGLDLKFGPDTGQFSIYARGLDGYIADKFKINYYVAA